MAAIMTRTSVNVQRQQCIVHMWLTGLHLLACLQNVLPVSVLLKTLDLPHPHTAPTINGTSKFYRARLCRTMLTQIWSVTDFLPARSAVAAA